MPININDPKKYKSDIKIDYNYTSIPIYINQFEYNIQNGGFIKIPYVSNSGDIRGIPINIETRGTGMAYQQVGILTPNGNNSPDLILPLMGRRLMTGRDKWQYYTMANGSSTIHAKLPVSVNGKSCTGEYGCNDIQNGDTVYVQGYNNVFTATIYENGMFSYIPVI